MSPLGTVEADVVEDLLLEFVVAHVGIRRGDGHLRPHRAAAAAILPSDRVAAIMEEIRGPAGRNMWDKLANVNEDVLANYLKNEYPQTVAVVLSKMKADHAARVLTILPEDLALEVVNRMLRMESVQSEALEHIEQTLRTEFMSNLSLTRRRDSHEMMAEIFNNFDRQTETRFLTALEEHEPRVGQADPRTDVHLRGSDQARSGSGQTLLRSVEKDVLAWRSRAPRAARTSSRQHVRARRQEPDRRHELHGPAAPEDVDEAQTRLVTLPRNSPTRARSCWPAPAATTS